jgi:hypothetical protein
MGSKMNINLISFFFVVLYFFFSYGSFSNIRMYSLQPEQRRRLEPGPTRLGQQQVPAQTRQLGLELKNRRLGQLLHRQKSLRQLAPIRRLEQRLVHSQHSELVLTPLPVLGLTRREP